jgi:23S rRNA (cytosine1962-C5)-methyltransferase
MGVGFLNRVSKISIRMLSRGIRDPKAIDEAYIEKRVRDAWEYRKKTVDTAACRVIFGEADFLPGIVIDKFNDVLVVESLALGIDRLKPVILAALRKCLEEDGISVRGIYERSDAPVRRKEGMEPFKGFIGEAFDTEVEIVENGVRYLVDVEDGQKTGFFLDQKYNRLAIHPICRDARVLDCFTHTGAFALHAAKGGAKHVTAVDISELAIEQARANAERNQITNIDFVCANVFELLTSRYEHGEKSDDFIILDPPAFTKSNATARDAFRGYKEINLKAMRLLPRGGFLATCSCSHFMKDDMFRQMLAEASHDACVSLRQIEARQQGPDHPILLNVPETNYLKFYLFQVV